jgi:hypothetical protein
VIRQFNLVIFFVLLQSNLIQSQTKATADSTAKRGIRPVGVGVYVPRFLLYPADPGLNSNEYAKLTRNSPFIQEFYAQRKHFKNDSIDGYLSLLAILQNSIMFELETMFEFKNKNTYFKKNTQFSLFVRYWNNGMLTDRYFIQTNNIPTGYYGVYNFKPNTDYYNSFSMLFSTNIISLGVGQKFYLLPETKRWRPFVCGQVAFGKFIDSKIEYEHTFYSVHFDSTKKDNIQESFVLEKEKYPVKGGYEISGAVSTGFDANLSRKKKMKQSLIFRFQMIFNLTQYQLNTAYWMDVKFDIIKCGLVYRF